MCPQPGQKKLSQTHPTLIPWPLEGSVTSLLGRAAFQRQKEECIPRKPPEGVCPPLASLSCALGIHVLLFCCCEFECESSNCQLPAQRFEVGLSACFSCTDAAQRDKTSCAIISTERLLSVWGWRRLVWNFDHICGCPAALHLLKHRNAFDLGWRARGCMKYICNVVTLAVFMYPKDVEWR